MAKSKTTKKTASKAARKTAKAAKKTTKAAKKTAKTSAKAAATKKKSPTRRNAAPADVLSLDERARLLKPRTNYLDTLERVTRVWGEYRALRVPGLTNAQLASLGRKAGRASDKEATFREVMEEKLAPLADARRVADDAAYRALLDTHAAIKLHARLDPGVIERFSFLSELVRSAPKEGGGARDTEVETEVETEGEDSDPQG